jgi:hypothetical protein
VWQIYRPAKGPMKALRKLATIRKFRKFSHDHLQVTAPFSRLEQLGRFDDCLAVVCGSDQIWNRHLTRGQYDPVFFLGHPMRARKIAYAASSGGHALGSDAALLRPMLRDFSAVGVREDFLREDLLASGICSAAETVVDPTLLIDDYDAVTSERYVPKGKGYIATYEVATPESRQRLEEAAARLRKALGLPIVHLGAKPSAVADQNQLSLSPGEWVGLMRRATAICTNSFHGLAFALNFRKHTVFVPHLEAEKNARPAGLLKLAGLERLTYAEGEDIAGDRHAAGHGRERLEALIARSRAFLTNSLQARTDREAAQ